MSNNVTKIIVSVLAVLVVGLILFKVLHKPVTGNATVPTAETAGYFSESVGSPIVFWGSALAGYSSGTNLQYQSSVGSCNTGTSTLFAIKPPAAATSTVIYTELILTAAATTTDITVGTSTTPALAFTSSTTTMPANYMAFGGIATSSTITVSNLGKTTNVSNSGLSGLGGINYSNQNPNIQVGPNEYLLANATSSYFVGTGGGLTGGSATTPAPTSCTYKIIWAN